VNGTDMAAITPKIWDFVKEIREIRGAETEEKFLILGKDETRRSADQ